MQLRELQKKRTTHFWVAFLFGGSWAPGIRSFPRPAIARSERNTPDPSLLTAATGDPWTLFKLLDEDAEGVVSQMAPWSATSGPLAEASDLPSGGRSASMCGWPVPSSFPMWNVLIHPGSICHTMSDLSRIAYCIQKRFILQVPLACGTCEWFTRPPPE